MPDRAALEDHIREAVAYVVRKQVEAGVDIVSDGEQGKFSYFTYVKDRLSGFEEEVQTPPLPIWRDYPEIEARQGASPIRMLPVCTGPVTRKRANDELQIDIGNLKAAAAEVIPTEVFMTAASPGVIAFYLRNDYYPTREAYLSDLAEAMKEEYEAIHRAGFLLQVDCPDLAMGLHLAFSDINTKDFLKTAQANVEALTTVTFR